MGSFYSVTFVFVFNRCLIQVFCPRCIMNSSYTFHIFTWICQPAFMVTSLYPSKIKSYVQERIELADLIFNSYQILTFKYTLNKVSIYIYLLATWSILYKLTIAWVRQSVSIDLLSVFAILDMFIENKGRIKVEF